MNNNGTFNTSAWITLTAIAYVFLLGSVFIPILQPQVPIAIALLISGVATVNFAFSNKRKEHMINLFILGYISIVFSLPIFFTNHFSALKYEGIVSLMLFSNAFYILFETLTSKKNNKPPYLTIALLSIVLFDLISVYSIKTGVDINTIIICSLHIVLINAATFTIAVEEKIFN